MGNFFIRNETNIPITLHPSSGFGHRIVIQGDTTESISAVGYYLISKAPFKVEKPGIGILATVPANIEYYINPGKGDTYIVSPIIDRIGSYRKFLTHFY